MFKNLTKFNYQKSGLEAVEFYIAYNAFFIVAIFILTTISWPITKFIVAYQTESFWMLGRFASIIFCMYLSSIIAKRKRILKEKDVILTIIISGFFAYINGSMFGLVPVSYLTTIASKDES